MTSPLKKKEISPVVTDESTPLGPKGPVTNAGCGNNTISPTRRLRHSGTPLLSQAGSPKKNNSPTGLEMNAQGMKKEWFRRLPS